MPRTRHVAAVGSVFFLVFAVWVLGDWSHGLLRLGVSDVTLFAAAAAATVFAALAARACHGRLRLGWLGITVGLLGWTVGQAIACYYELVLERTPFPSPADAAYLIFPIGACIGLLLMPTEHTRRFRGRVFLDGLIVAGSLFLVSWVTVLGPIYTGGGTDRLAFFVSLTYPASDLVTLTLAAVVLVRSDAEHRVALTLVTVGVACIALSDSVWTYLTVLNEYESGDVIDIGWVAGLLLIAVAAAASRQSTRDDTDAAELPGWASVWLPYAPLLLAGIVVAAKPPTMLRSGPVEIIGALLVIAVLARQFLAVSENRTLLATVAEQALRDPLTRLANRSVFNERLDSAMAVRDRDGTSVGVVTLDLNDFKLVNDHLGHPVGDDLLIGVANRLGNCAREGDTVARLGGDEFSILVCGGVDAAHLVAHRVVEAFERPFVLAGHELLVRPSVGLAVADGEEAVLSSEELVRRADTAMYTAKRARSRNVQSYDPELKLTDEAVDAQLLNESATSRDSDGVLAIQLLGDLRHAIANGDLTLVYQPKFELSTGRIVGAEALLRWPRPDGQVLTPDDFLPLVRRHGMMGPVTDFVINRALDDALVWQRASFDVPVAVNLFAPSLANLGIPAKIDHALAERGLDPASITVEITEDMFLDHLERTRSVLEDLRRNGIRIAIDDFGSGYSALSYLRELPIDEVKLDRTFIEPILTDERAAAVVEAVVGLAHVLGLVIVVEGVEDAETAAKVREYGSDIGQGFYFSRPVSAPQLLELLRRQAPASARSRSTP